MGGGGGGGCVGASGTPMEESMKRRAALRKRRVKGSVGCTRERCPWRGASCERSVVVAHSVLVARGGKGGGDG